MSPSILRASFASIPLAAAVLGGVLGCHHDTGQSPNDTMGRSQRQGPSPTAAPEGTSETPAPSATSQTRPPPDQGGASQAQTPPAQTPPTQSPPVIAAEESFDDQQILGVLSAANNVEIEQAKLAAGKTRNAKVKQLAMHLVSDHTDVDRRAHVLMERTKLTPAETALSANLRTDGQRRYEALQTKSGDDLDRDFVDTQVRLHARLIDLIDSRLLPQAKSPELRAQIQQIRAMVDGHLRTARNLQSQLSSSQPSTDQNAPR